MIWDYGWLWCDRGRCLLFIFPPECWDLSRKKILVRAPCERVRQGEDEKVVFPMGPRIVREHSNYAATEKRRRPLQTWPWWQVNNIFTIYFQLKSREIKNYKTFHSPRSPISIENFKLVRKSLTNWICFFSENLRWFFFLYCQQPQWTFCIPISFLLTRSTPKKPYKFFKN